MLLPFVALRAAETAERDVRSTERRRVWSVVPELAIAVRSFSHATGDNKHCI